MVDSSIMGTRWVDIGCIGIGVDIIGEEIFNLELE